jgi:WW domain
MRNMMMKPSQNLRDSKPGLIAKQQQPLQQPCMWRSAIDPASKKEYYYHVETRESQWTKPLELCSEFEREAATRKAKQLRDFFSEMESNIRGKLQQGLSSVDIENARHEEEREHAAVVADNADKTLPRSSTAPASQQWGTVTETPRMLRTISTMDASVLEELARAREESEQRRKDGTTQLQQDKKPTARASFVTAVKHSNFTRRNSTSTVTHSDTMSDPDRDTTILCVCACYRAHIVESSAVTEEDDKGLYTVFDDEVNACNLNTLYSH